MLILDLGQNHARESGLHEVHQSNLISPVDLSLGNLPPVPRGPGAFFAVANLGKRAVTSSPAECRRATDEQWHQFFRSLTYRKGGPSPRLYAEPHGR
jgi:hypothetical protein